MNPAFDKPIAPVTIDALLDDPGEAIALAKRGAPYATVQRYVRNLDEMATLSRAGDDAKEEASAPGPMIIAPWFRGDWAYDTPRVDGAERILEHPALFEAARAMHPGARHIRPQIVYANLQAPMPQVDPGHTDVPAFRGFDRTEHPIWLLVAMLKSGLFDRWRIPLVTAVAWYYEGDGGGFRYWADGPAQPPIDRPCRPNSAVVGDNDHMFHCVLPVGEGNPPLLPGLTLDSQLLWQDGAWNIVDAGQVLHRIPPEALRLSVSWKAQIFATDEDLARYEEGREPLTLEMVEAMLMDALRERGIEVEREGHLHTDRRLINALNRAFQVRPSNFTARPAE